MLKFKKALKEIFEAEMVVGKSLYGKCDGILGSVLSSLPGKVNRFILLGDYFGTDIRTGELNKKYRGIDLEIVCGSVVDDKQVDSASLAEEYSWELARLVRTILKANRKLVSASYSDGVATKSHINEDNSEFGLVGKSTCALVVISFRLVLEEAA